jgi:phenylalanyl-tRNA synthetase alpha chain
VENVVDETAEQLRAIDASGAGPDAVVKELQKRKLVGSRKLLHYSARKGPAFATEVKVLETDLTADMLANGAWKDSEFKQYNFAAMGEPTDGGALHPLLKVREEFRQIFFDMG